MFSVVHNPVLLIYDFIHANARCYYPYHLYLVRGLATLRTPLQVDNNLRMSELLD